MDTKINVFLTKEDLRKFTFFNYYKTSNFRKILPFVAIIVGILGIWISIINFEPAIFGLSLFLLLYPPLILLILIISSDRVYKSNQLYNDTAHYTFTDDEVTAITAISSLTVSWDKFYKVYLGKKEIALYLNKVQAIYIIKTKYDETTIRNIEEIINKNTPQDILKSI